MADKARLFQIIGEFFVKASHHVLAARIPQGARVPLTLPKGSRPWFSLESEELVCAQAILEPWKRDCSSPLVIEIFLLPWVGTKPTAAEVPPDGANGSGTGGRSLLERWVIHFEPSETRETDSKGHSASYQMKEIYKRLVIVMRSLYSYLRILPAHRLYRAYQRNSVHSFSLQYRVSRGDPATAMEKLPSHRMKNFAFKEIDVQHGKLRMAVDYRTSLQMNFLEQTTAPLARPQIIADYIGGHTGFPPRRLKCRDRNEVPPLGVPATGGQNASSRPFLQPSCD
eukprot:jgi/Botrbrau1/19356/Bobra.0628s0001.1